MAIRQKLVFVAVMLLASASELAHGAVEPAQEDTNPALQEAYWQEQEQDQQQLEVQRINGQLVVNDLQCNITDVEDINVDLAFGFEDVEDDEPLNTFFLLRSSENNGLANTSSPVCASPAVSLITPCTQSFSVTEYANGTYIVKPNINVFVSAECDVSHCQGASGILGSDGISGTFHARGTGEPTFQFSYGIALGSRDTVVTIVVPGQDLTCTLHFEEEGYLPNETWFLEEYGESVVSESEGV